MREPKVPRAERRASVRMELDRRRLIAGAAGLAALAAFPVSAGPASGNEPLRFGLTPVFLSNDIELLAGLRAYLEAATGREVRLVTRRTYQEITALLVSAQLDAAWICGYPFVQFADQLDLVAVPVWRERTLYQSYLVVRRGRTVGDVEDLRGDVHAFSDPDSNSGFLVTRALLAERGTDPERFFRRTIFTYGHRNVVRAVASGLVQSGSVDGYVLEVLAEVEPELAGEVSVVRRSEWLGFPPIAAPASHRGSAETDALRRALLAMGGDAAGRLLLDTLRLDGFAERPASLFDPIAAKLALVRSFG